MKSGSYYNHKKLENHPTTREAIGEAIYFAPDIIETCSTCGQRWLFQPHHDYALALTPMLQGERV